MSEHPNKRKAVGFLRAALAMRARNAVALTCLGELSFLQNRNDEAEEALRAGVAADSQCALARARLALILYFLGRPKSEVAPLARQALADAPGLPHVHLVQGLMLILQGEDEPEKAFATIQIAFRFDKPEKPRVRQLFGRAVSG